MGEEVKERVLMHKESGELCLVTNRIGLIESPTFLSFTVLLDRYGTRGNWDEEYFTDLGFL